MIPITQSHDMSKDPLGFIETHNDRLVVRMNEPTPAVVVFSIFGNVGIRATKFCEINGEQHFSEFEILCFAYSPAL